MSERIKLLVGIPTLNRSQQLVKTLITIAKNTFLPDRVLIVDQSYNNETERVVETFSKKLNIEYLRVSYRGLTKARNDILKRSDCFDVITFLDDDVKLREDYLERIVKAFENDEELAGCQGFIENQGGFKDLLLRFLNGAPPSSRPVVTECFVNTYPYFPPFHPISSEWLSGCNMSYRVKFVKGEKFDENFILYGLGEDLEFSHRLFNKGAKLLMIPSARLKHIPSGLNRLPNKAGIMMRFAYRRYMIAKFYPNRVEEMFWRYVKWYKRAFRTLRIRRSQHWRQIMDLVDTSLKELEGYFPSIDKGDLSRVNALILKETQK